MGSTVYRGAFTSGYWVLLYIARYEDLKNNTNKEVNKILDFLGVQYSPEQVEKNLLAADFSTFKRSVEKKLILPVSCLCPCRKKHAQFQHFTSEQRLFIRDTITKTVSFLRRNNHGVTYGIENYLDQHIAKPK